ncbi:MAG: type II toxin-antitoxin system PemK/MazF family toxin [Patescibacteria group bacterium]|nr:type II toxin-antitoxin system PemK/MazF family toxin [Patescibacteria group bacterium]
MAKAFDIWNSVKKRLDDKVIGRDFYFNEREIWWCSLGLNVGVESDGKSDTFERPVLIIKKFNGDMVWIVPLTGMPHDDRYHRKIAHGRNESWACLTQIRTISTKRLLRKVGTLEEAYYQSVVEGVAANIKTKPSL